MGDDDYAEAINFKAISTPNINNTHQLLTDVTLKLYKTSTNEPTY
jgi:hypothetical protein